mmetsp:Transcript_21456/g.55763  ORF Transcript_21456/g.55763 Transcript_21456/m.55763 type:complete len:242 (-) Transcript_21456:257-982(-)
MANRLGKIFGTEEDRVNCPFYYKIGACRHGDRCSRKHVKPTFSPTVLLPHLWQPIALGAGRAQEEQEMFDDFFEEVFEELQKFGEIECLEVCDNLCDHLIGNVYIKYVDEESAARCLQGLTGRFFAGRLLQPELSPVTDFREARCRQYDTTSCNRGGHCNFLHVRKVTEDLRRFLYKTMKRMHGSKKRDDPVDRRKRRRRGVDYDYDRDGTFSDSAERRRLISKWNREREEKIKEAMAGQQ